ncbi:3-deoxy-manno-octulosonate cytidylyltransferase [Vibrio navarrensis]
MNKSVKVVIPARYASSRLPGKPLLELDGYPMFWHVVKQVQQAGFASSDIVLATDDQRIVDSAKLLDIPVVLTSINHASGTDRLNEVSELMRWCDDTLVVNVQGDEPLIPSELIKQLAEFALQSNDFDICTAISPLHSINDLNNSNIVKVAMGEDHRAMYFSRAPIPCHRDEPSSLADVYRHIGIYTYRVKTLRDFCSFPESRLEKWEKLEQLRALSNGLTIGAIYLDVSPPHGIDTEEDYYKIKQQMEK